jgi:hypothetical protein
LTSDEKFFTITFPIKEFPMRKMLPILCSSFVIASSLMATDAIAGVAPLMTSAPTLSFLQPTATVSPTAPVDVWIHMTAGAGGFNLDSGATNYGFDLGYLSSGLGIQVDSVTSASLTVGFSCSGTFTSTACVSGPPYDFSWNYGTNGVLNGAPLVLAEGATFDYLFGTFTPSNGPVAPGTYNFYNSHLEAWVSGVQSVQQFDINGNPLLDANGQAVYVQQDFNSALIDLAQTCPLGPQGCGFSRTVVGGNSVPEPGTDALLWLSLGLLFATSRRKKSAL